jgi:hypothetical protein
MGYSSIHKARTGEAQASLNGNGKAVNSPRGFCTWARLTSGAKSKISYWKNLGKKF